MRGASGLGRLSSWVIFCNLDAVSSVRAEAHSGTLSRYPLAVVGAPALSVLRTNVGSPKVATNTSAKGTLVCCDVREAYRPQMPGSNYPQANRSPFYNSGVAGSMIQAFDIHVEVDRSKS
jgi:hypothetical protein